MVTKSRTVFDTIVEQFVNERLDDIMMQDTKYIKLQEEIWKEWEMFDKLNLSEIQRSVIENLISLHIKVIELYSKKAYGQGFGDCISVLQEIGMIRKLQPKESSAHNIIFYILFNL